MTRGRTHVPSVQAPRRLALPNTVSIIRPDAVPVVLRTPLREDYKISLSDYVRVRLGLRPDGSQNGGGGEALTGTDDAAIRAQLADHERRLPGAMVSL
jgi:hypothetical protein